MPSGGELAGVAFDNEGRDGLRPEGDEDDEDDRAGDEDENGDGDEDEQSEADSAFMGDDDSDASDEYAPSVASAGHVEKIAAAEAGEASEQRLMGREDHRTLAGVTKLAAARSRARAKESWLNDERDKVLLDMPRVARPKLTRIERASIAPKRLYCVGAMLHRTPELAYADGTRNPISLRRRPIGRVERFLATDWRPSGVRPRTEAADVFSSPDGTATPGRGTRDGTGLSSRASSAPRDASSGAPAAAMGEPRMCAPADAATNDPSRQGSRTLRVPPYIFASARLVEMLNADPASCRSFPRPLLESNRQPRRSRAARTR